MAADTKDPEPMPSPALRLAPVIAPVEAGARDVAPEAPPGAPPDVDAELVRRAQRGDRTAFGQLFKRHHGRVQAMCVRLLGSSGGGAMGAGASEVEDAVQQTFLEAWRCLGRFEGRSRFTTWITRVAIHTCFSTRRRLRRLLVTDTSVEERAIVPAWVEADLPADEVAARHARERAVAEVLARLSPRKRTVFVLADLDGLTSTEIAEILEIPDATVRTRLFHARREVAAAVRAHPGFVDVLAGRGALRGEDE